MQVVFETEAYSVKREYTGNYMIEAKSSRKDIYLQGDDATQLENELDHLWNSTEFSDEQLNGICREYRHLMT